jgi:ubiquinone/menaquinone biosynthesis C-methylase UbiE
MKEYESWWQNRLSDDKKFERFAEMLQSQKALIRRGVKEYIKGTDYKTMLDCGAGLCRDGAGLQDIIKWYGIDITPIFVQKGKKNGFRIKLGSIEDIPYKMKFDLVYCKAVLEHLRYYEYALLEMNRVAKKEVMVVFFRNPREDDREICVIKREITGKLYEADYNNKDIDRVIESLEDYYFQNTYNKKKMMNFIDTLPDVKDVIWHDVYGQSILHILKNES